KLIPVEESRLDDATLLYHDLFTNGIAYVDFAFDLHRLPKETLPYLSLYTRSLLSMGTEDEDYVKLSQRIGRKTGGIRASALVTSVLATRESTAWLVMRGKGAMPQTDDLFAIMSDVLSKPRLDNQARFRQLVLEDKA